MRVCRCDPLTCFGIRSGEAGEPLRAAVRLFKRPDDSVCGMLYEEERVTPFTWDGQRVALGAPEENLPGHLALVPFNNNCRTCGDFEMVTGLMDAYNLLLSGAMDDMQSVASTLLSLSPLLSRRTILEQLPWVKDAEEELRRKAEETTETEK